MGIAHQGTSGKARGQARLTTGAMGPVLFNKKPLDGAEEHYQAALRHRDRKKKEFDFGLSLWHFRQAIGLEPNNPTYHCQLAKAYAAAPLLAVSRGIGGSVKLRDAANLAVSEAKEAIRLKPDYAEAFLILGEAYMYLGDKDKALKAFEVVPELCSSGQLTLHAEKESEQVEKGISRRPDPVRAKKHLEQAIMNVRKKKYRGAEKELNKAIRLAPDWSWLYHTVCELSI